MTDSADIFGSLWAGLRPWAESIAVLGIGAGAGLLAAAAVSLVLRHGVHRHNAPLADSLRTHCSRTLGWFLPLLGMYLALPLSGPAAERAWLPPLLVSLLILGIGMLLVLPISYFLENPFTNWTRRTAEILGTVFLHVDYSVPLDALRKELERLVQDHPDWDGRVAEIVAFESRPTTLEIRALVSAGDSGAAWRLRCHVREGLVTFLQQNYPAALPRFRAEVENRGQGTVSEETVPWPRFSWPRFLRVADQAARRRRASPAPTSPMPSNASVPGSGTRPMVTSSIPKPSSRLFEKMLSPVMSSVDTKVR